MTRLFRCLFPRGYVANGTLCCCHTFLVVALKTVKSTPRFSIHERVILADLHDKNQRK